MPTIVSVGSITIVDVNDGAPGPAVVVTGNRPLNFTATDGVLDSAQPDIVLTAEVFGLASAAYVWTFLGFETSPVSSGTSVQTITMAQFGTSRAASVTCTVNGLYTSQVTIVRAERSTAAAGATVGATFGDYNGVGKNISGTITPGNVTTYIDNAAIGNAQIANASITNAKIANAAILAANIANAQINTLHVGPDQITVPRYIESSAAVSTPTSGSWYEVLSFNSFPAIGAPVLLFVTIDSSKRTRLLRNGDVLYDFEVPKDGNNFLILGQVSFMVYDSNPGDYPNYTVQIYRSTIHWNSSTYDRPRKLAIFAMKR